MYKPIQSKIVTLGDFAVGKSSLIQRYVKNNFTEARNQTLGAEFSPKQIIRNGQIIELQIWDTAGQEVYRSIAKLYYQGIMQIQLDAHFAILVYDVTSSKSFEVLKFWMNKLTEDCSQELTKFIVANKIDLESKVSLEEVKSYAAAFDPPIEVYTTSCKENIGVFELFNKIGDIVYEREQTQKQKNKELKTPQPLKIGSPNQDQENTCC